MEQYNEELVFETVALAGEVLLASGAEIFRVTDTMQRIATAYGCPQLDSFVVSNGVLLSTGGQGRRYQAKVSHIPLGSSRLDRIDAVNQFFVVLLHGSSPWRVMWGDGVYTPLL